MHTRYLLALAACAVLESFAASAADAPPAGRPGAPGEHFAALDKDGDGKLSRAEAAAAPRLAGKFDKVDTNGDGFLTRDELHAARAQAREKMGERAEQHFATADKNGDGQIDPGEAQAGMPHAAAHFQQLDRDHNGTLSREELREGAITQWHEHRQQNRPPVASPPQP